MGLVINIIQTIMLFNMVGVWPQEEQEISQASDENNGKHMRKANQQFLYVYDN